MKLFKLFIILLLIIFFNTTLAVERYPFTNEKQRRQFFQLTHRFRCLVCQNEDLAASNAGLADDLRHQIYEMVIAGKSDVEITQYMVKRYGDFVLLKPPLNGNTFLLWAAPFLLLLIGLLILVRIVKRFRA